jgi:hypothetical protein
MEPLEEAEERRFAAVADAEAAGEAAVGGEAVPAPADKGRAGERGGLRREAEEDLSEEVVVFQRGRTGATAEAAHLEKQRLRRRAGAAAAAAAGCLALLMRVFFSVSSWRMTRNVQAAESVNVDVQNWAGHESPYGC